MSASLVGSEMCIRDRRNTGRARIARESRSSMTRTVADASLPSFARMQSSIATSGAAWSPGRAL
eukprot:4947327-Alexandrium_andersonii.AAC.1